MADLGTLTIQVVTAGIQQANQSLTQLGQQGQQTNQHLAQVNTTIGRMEQQLGALTGTASRLQAAFIALVGALALGQVIRIADEWQLLEARLKNVTLTATELTGVQTRLFQVAQQTRGSFSELVGLYTRIAIVTKEAGVSSEQLIQTTKNVSMALQVSGASAQEAASTMRQLAQAMGSGRLSGDEFRSLAENAPRLMKVLADSMNVPIGKLKELAGEGKLTTAEMVKAWGTANAQLEREFRNMPVTVAGAMQVVSNSFMKMVGEANQASSATSILSQGLLDLAKRLETPEFQGAAVAFAQALASAFQQAADAAAFLARNLDLIMPVLGAMQGARLGSMFGPWGAALGGIAGASAAYMLQSNEAADTTGKLSAAMGRLQEAANGVSAAQTTTAQKTYEMARQQAMAALEVEKLTQSMLRQRLDDALNVYESHRAYRSPDAPISKDDQRRLDNINRISRELEIQTGIVRTTMQEVAKFDEQVKAVGVSSGTTAGQTQVLARSIGELKGEALSAAREMQKLAEVNLTGSLGSFQTLQAAIARMAGSSDPALIRALTEGAIGGIAQNQANQSRAATNPEAYRRETLQAQRRQFQSILDAQGAGGEPGYLGLNPATLDRVRSAIAGIDAELSKGSKSAQALGNSYADATARLRDSVSELASFGSTGLQAYQALEAGSKKWSASQIEEMTRLRQTEAVLKDLNKIRGEVDSYIKAAATPGIGGDLGTMQAGINLQERQLVVIGRLRDEIGKYSVGTKTHTDLQVRLNEEEEKAVELGQAIVLWKQRAIEETQKLVDAIDKQTQNIEDQNALLALEAQGLSKTSEQYREAAKQIALTRVEREKELALKPLQQELARLVERNLDSEIDQREILIQRIKEVGDAYDRQRDSTARNIDLTVEAERAREAADAMTKPFEEAGKNIYNALAGALEDVFDGGIDDVQDFASTMLNIFKKLAAQIAALLIFQPVVGGILSGLGVSDDFQRRLGIVNGGGSLFGGSSGGGILGDVFSLGSNGAKIGGFDLFGSLFGSAATYSAVPAASTALAPSLLLAEGGGVAAGSGLLGGSGAAGVAGTTAAGGFSLSAAIPYIGAAIAIFSIASSLFKQKPSNKGAEYSFMTDADWTTQFEGTKHPEQMALVKSFAEPLQSAIVDMEDRFGAMRRADATIGANFGIKEGSSFFYDAGPRDGGIEGRQVFSFDPEDEASIQKALDQLMVAFLKDADWSGLGDRIGKQAAEDVATALENSAATTLAELTADMAFAETFDSFAELGRTLDPMALAVQQFTSAGVSAADALIKKVDDFNQKADDLGLGAEVLENGMTRADYATKGFALSLLGLEQPLTAVESATITAEAYIDRLTPALQRWGFSMEEIADITEQVTQRMVAAAQAAQQASLAAANASYYSAWQPGYVTDPNLMFTQLGISPADFPNLFSSIAGFYANPTQAGHNDAIQKLKNNLANQHLLNVTGSDDRANSVFNSLVSYLSTIASNRPQSTIGGGSDTGGSNGGGTDTDGGGSDRPDNSERIGLLQDQLSTTRELISTLQRNSDIYARLALQLGQFRESLLLQEGLTPLTPEQQLAEARRQFEAAFAKAMMGDQDAMQALPDLSTKLLEISRRYFASSENYQRDFDRVQEALLQVQQVSRTYEEQNLAQLATANQTLKNIETEIAALRTAQSGGSTGGGSTGGGGDGGGTGGTPTTPAAGTYVDPATGQTVNILFGRQWLGRGANEAVGAYMSRIFPGYTGPANEQTALDWLNTAHGFGADKGLSISKLQYYSIAAQAGYPVGTATNFASGKHAAWLDGDSTGGRWMAFIDYLRAFASGQGITIEKGYWDPLRAQHPAIPQGYWQGGAFWQGAEEVVHQPTLFPTRYNGTAMMGERGAEGVLPLKRDRQGNLGVVIADNAGPAQMDQNAGIATATVTLLAEIKAELVKLNRKQQREVA